MRLGLRALLLAWAAVSAFWLLVVVEWGSLARFDAATRVRPFAPPCVEQWDERPESIPVVECPRPGGRMIR